MRQCMVDGSVRTIDAGYPDIRYLDMVYDNFSAREVVLDGNHNGEFHINAGKLNHSKFVSELQSKIVGEIFVIDPENYLNLEYNICVKVNPEGLDYITIAESFAMIDELITRGK